MARERNPVHGRRLTVKNGFRLLLSFLPLAFLGAGRMDPVCPEVAVALALLQLEAPTATADPVSPAQTVPRVVVPRTRTEWRHGPLGIRRWRVAVQIAEPDRVGAQPGGNARAPGRTTDTPLVRPPTDPAAQNWPRTLVTVLEEPVDRGPPQRDTPACGSSDCTRCL